MEREFYDINKKTVDRGWKAMQEMLDREMPTGEQPRRRRRFIFWWWLAFVPVATVVATWFVFSEKTKPEPCTVPARPADAKTPVAALPSEGDATRGGIESKVAENQRVETVFGKNNRPENPKIFNSKIGGAAAVKAIPKADDFSKKEKPQQVGVAAATSSTASFSETENVEKTVLKSVPPAETAAVEQASGVSTAENLGTARQFLDLKKLGTKPFALASTAPQSFDFQQVEPLFVERPTVEKFSENKFSLGLTANFSEANGLSTKGYAAGLVAEWQPFRRFGLRSGLQYQFLHAKNVGQNPTFPAAKLDGYTYFNETLDSTILDGFAITGTPNNPVVVNAYEAELKSTSVYIFANRLHRLEMPLLLTFEPHRKWQLSAGAVGSWVMSALVAGASNEENAGFDTAGQLSADASGLQSLVKTYFPRWDWQMTGGVAFRPTRHWEVNFGIRKSLVVQFGNQKLESRVFLEDNSTTLSRSKPFYFFTGASYFF